MEVHKLGAARMTKTIKTSTLSDDQIEFVLQRLKEGKPLPEEFKWLLFEGKQEAELGYFGKERDIDIITETMAVPLQRVKSFGENNFIKI